MPRLALAPTLLGLTALLLSPACGDDGPAPSDAATSDAVVPDAPPTDSGPSASPARCGPALECAPGSFCVSAPAADCMLFPPPGGGPPVCNAEYECRELPSECDGQRSCDCITAQACPRGTGMCEMDGYGNATWRCLIG